MRVGNSGRSCHEAPEPWSTVTLLEVVLPMGRLDPEVPCPHADNDRIVAIRTKQSPTTRPLNHPDSSSSVGTQRALQRYRESTTGVSSIKPMFRAEIQWLASGPTLKLEGKLVG